MLIPAIGWREERNGLKANMFAMRDNSTSGKQPTCPDLDRDSIVVVGESVGPHQYFQGSKREGKEMTTRALHFTIDAPFVVQLARQAYWMEHRQQWAVDTLKTFQGITDQQIDAILRGTASLVNSKDGERAVYTEAADTAWQETLAKHLAYIDSKYYTFGNRRVSKELVDDYAGRVVKRLRDAMRSPSLIRFQDPVMLMSLEEQRRDQHLEIIREAGFTQEDIEKRNSPRKWSKDYEVFDREFSLFLDKATDWLTEDAT